MYFYLSSYLVGKAFLHQDLTSKDNSVNEVFLNYLLMTNIEKNYSASHQYYGSKNILCYPYTSVRREKADFPVGDREGQRIFQLSHGSVVAHGLMIVIK